MQGKVVMLDRSLPLVRLEDGRQIRCKHSTELVKCDDVRAVIGDIVDISLPAAHDVGVIEHVEPRKTQLVRKDPTDRALPQVLAANFDTVMVAQPIVQLNVRRLQREIVLAFETGAHVVVLLTKSDLATNEQIESALMFAKEMAGPASEVVVVGSEDSDSIERVRSLIPPDSTAVLLGRSGVGKSTLINLLTNNNTRRTGGVREGDGKGRHTTVNRAIVDVPGGGSIVDMPGVRGLGLWDAETGIDAAFADIERIAEGCRFRDCRHGEEPGCAVRAALEDGTLSHERLDSYMQLRRETAEIQQRREEARWNKRESRPRRKPTRH